MWCGINSKNVTLLCIFLSLGLNQVCPIQVSSPTTLSAAQGDAVTLKCTFWSHTSATSMLSVDWSFRPQSGGPAHTFFHFFSVEYPPKEGPFQGRVKWQGNPRWGVASILLLNASLSDNGTYTCTVRNPPDVHGAPAHIQLTVTPRGHPLRFTYVAVLLALVLLPSVIIALLLLGRACCLGCCCRSPRWDEPPVQGLHSTDRERALYEKPTTKQQIDECCKMYLQDPEFGEYYIHNKRLQAEIVDEAVAESQC
ncbi:hypothetical protein MATL_G00043900 [Megalops atlanticus]|uniref:Ig-like domain-containing protein n=1 Tax=Megalops atlanticus TaxID=7932 RepID=A0A9D3QBK2_MEGAT|nr:hypothetical protein MATL_G00043900 [Megalops atlanticus]